MEIKINIENEDDQRYYYNNLLINNLKDTLIDLERAVDNIYNCEFYSKDTISSLKNIKNNVETFLDMVKANKKLFEVTYAKKFIQDNENYARKFILDNEN